MLQDLVYGIEKSSLLLIEDCAFHSGFSILKCILKSRLRTGKRVHLFCYENSPEEYLNDMSEYSSKLKIHNGHIDPLHWDNLSGESDLCNYELCKDINNLNNNEPVTVLIDSLSYVLLHNIVKTIYKSLDLLKRKATSFPIEQVVCLHADVHSEETVELFENLATTILKLSNSLPFACLSIHKKSNKIIKEFEEYNVNDACDIYCIKKTEVKEIPQKIDPTVNLTFNLHLKENEKIVRENLVLPYTEVKETGGCIFFQPEDEDFEDPDDDLDI